MSKKKVLITGGNGLLGANACVYMSSLWDIHILSRNHICHFDGITSHLCDIQDLVKLRALIGEIEPEYILHAAGMTNVDACEKSYYKAYLANVVGSKNMAIICNERNIELAHVSTDHFSTDEDFSTEDVQGFPVNHYAKTKLDAEYEVLRNNKNSLVLRTNFIGWGHDSRKSFSDFIVDNLRAKNKISLFDDVKFNPTLAQKLVQNIDALWNKKSKGIFNVVSCEGMSKYEFGLLVADVFELDKSYIKKGSIEDKQLFANRPRNLTLSSEKLVKELGENSSLNLREALELLKKDEFEIKSAIKGKVVEQQNSAAIFYGKQFIDDNDFESVMNTLGSDFLTQGPKVAEFEELLAKKIGCKYAVAVSSWTSGLHISVLACGIKDGDKVITSPISFVASSNAAIYAGAEPIFADIEQETLNICPKSVEKICKENPDVKAIIPVHFAGHPCKMKELKEIADKYKVKIIEDAAHALGGEYLDGGFIGNGSYGDIAGFSFHPVKSITTGEGALITTNNEYIYKQLLRLRSHGITKGGDLFKNEAQAFTNGKVNPWYHEMQQLGYNFRITDLQCALGVSQVNKLDMFVKRRKEICRQYDDAFSKHSNLEVLQVETRMKSGNHLYVLGVKFSSLGLTRHGFFEKVKEKGIYLHVHYIPIYRQPYYVENYGDQVENFPNAESYYEKAVTLPLHPSLTDEQVNYIIKTIEDVAQ